MYSHFNYINMMSDAQMLITNKKSHNMVSIPQKNVNDKPFNGSPWAVPSVDRAHIHNPGLPRRTRTNESFDMMSKTIYIKRKVIKIVNVLCTEILCIINEQLCQSC